MANESLNGQICVTPGMPLFQLSPERVNKHRGLPQSPSVPIFIGPGELSDPGYLADSAFSRQNEAAALKTPTSPSRQENVSPFGKNDDSKFSPPKHVRTNSDVQGMVARFNTLEIRDRSEEMRKKDAAALRRAQMGREEAEADVKRLREENRAQQREIDEGKDRERRVVKRLDVVMEDLHRSKETQAHAQTLYEKEIRRARKEAFKSSSVMVKLQEELKAARLTLKLLHSDLELEKIKVGRREQEAFAAQYQLVGVQEDLTRAQTQIKVVEEERDALKTNLKEEEVARIAAEGRIALPPACAGEDEFSSPQKQKPQVRSASPEKEPSRTKIELDELRAELCEQRQRQAMAEEQVEFMKMECQFGCCSCRVAERHGTPFMHDGTFDAEVEFFKTSVAGMPTPPGSMLTEEDRIESGANPAGERQPAENRVTLESADRKEVDASEGLVFSPSSGTFRKQAGAPAPATSDNSPSNGTEVAKSIELGNEFNNRDFQIKHTPDVLKVDQEAGLAEQQLEVSQPLVQVRREPKALKTRRLSRELGEPDEQLEPPSEPAQPELQSMDTQPDELEPPQTPANSNWRTVTTTTKVPLAEPSSTDYSAFASPKITREEAIEQLRLRRGRARSITGTPKKAGGEAYMPRRDISAPEVRAKTAQSATRGRHALR